MSHNNVDIYKGIKYLSNLHYQLLEYIFVLCINNQNNAVSRYFGNCSVKWFYGIYEFFFKYSFPRMRLLRECA